MKPLRVYIDTSVFGGYFDDEFSVVSRQFFDAVFGGQVISLVSETLVAELIPRPSMFRTCSAEPFKLAVNGWS